MQEIQNYFCYISESTKSSQSFESSKSSKSPKKKPCNQKHPALTAAHHSLLSWKSSKFVQIGQIIQIKRILPYLQISIARIIRSSKFTRINRIIRSVLYILLSNHPNQIINIKLSESSSENHSSQQNLSAQLEMVLGGPAKLIYVFP